MKKWLLLVFIFCISILAACSNTPDNSESIGDKSAVNVEEDSSEEMSNFGTDNVQQQEIKPKEDNHSSDIKKINNPSNRKVIYTADLQIEVKSYHNTLNDIQKQVDKMNGYIVESNMFEDEESGTKNGQLTARIPQEKFQEFIKLVEDGSNKVLESSTSGQDVTEEYVDLESRLKSKHVVEKRLLSFMEDAKKTEDLLQISNDLAEVQAEIEEITGRMKYLENKSDLATVSIYIQEKNVTLSGTGQDQLNTWEQTKEQFMKSINFLITTFSSLFVFLIGNLPVFLLVGIIGVVVFLIIWRKRK